MLAGMQQIHLCPGHSSGTLPLVALAPAVLAAVWQRPERQALMATHGIAAPLYHVVCTMSSKLVKSQLNSVLRAIDKKQQGDGKKGGASQVSGGRRGKRSRQAKRQAAAAKEQEQEQRTAVLAANLRYFAKTTTAKGKAQDLVTQVKHCMPPPLPPVSSCAGSPLPAYRRARMHVT